MSPELKSKLPVAWFVIQATGGALMSALPTGPNFLGLAMAFIPAAVQLVVMAPEGEDPLDRFTRSLTIGVTSLAAMAFGYVVGFCFK